MLLAREEGNEKQPNVKMRGLGGGGGAVLKGMPLLRCRAIPRRALPFPAREGERKGSGRPRPWEPACWPRVGIPASPRGWPGTGPGPGASRRAHPTLHASRSGEAAHAWKAGPRRQPIPAAGARTSTPAASAPRQTDGSARGGWAGRACAPVRGCRTRRTPPARRARGRRRRGGSGTGLGPAHRGSKGFLSLCALRARKGGSVGGP